MKSAPKIPRRISAEAAAWLARLLADDKRVDDDARFRAWLEKDPRCGVAFMAIMEVWDLTGALHHGNTPGPDATIGRQPVAPHYSGSTLRTLK